MNGWDVSAQAWIASLGEHGDKGRRYVLDPWMRRRIEGDPFRAALDVGCGEGRLCRAMRTWGVAETTGIDPTRALLARARELDPHGRYDEGYAERLPYDADAFDLVVSCLSLIDIPDFRAGIAEMARVLAPGGTLLMTNLTAMATTVGPRWIKHFDGRKLHYAIDAYMDEDATWEEWRGIRVLNHHRPLSAYMQAFLANGLILRTFEELQPVGAGAGFSDDQRRVPWFIGMEWSKP